MEIAARETHFVQLASHFVQLTSYFMQLTSHFIQLTSHFMQLTSYLIQLASHFMQLTSDFIQLTSHFILRSFHFIQLTYYSLQMAELTHLIADYKNALLRPGAGAPGTPQMNSLTRNGSHRSARKPTSTLPHSTPSTLPHMHQLSQSHHTHHTTGHNTLNSHATTMTLGSDRNATLTLSSHTSTFNQHGEARVLSHGQPDILKSTPDHHRSDKKRSHTQDSGVA